MNILLLGNGFDLHHFLPTRYDNFLHTVDFLLQHYDEEKMNTIEDIFGNAQLLETDKFLVKCHERYQTGYKTINLDKGCIKKIIDLAKNNKWFQYFLTSYNKELGWIDFEKEIANVLKAFEALFVNNKIYFNVATAPFNNENAYILFFFKQYFDAAGFQNINGSHVFMHKVVEQFTIEEPFGSKNYKIDKKKICNTLFDELLDLSEVLKLYLKCFIIDTIQPLDKQQLMHYISAYYADFIITLNYTNTYELLYSAFNVFHIHGSCFDKIVLGVNSDNADELYDLNTDFICFKKYYQRVLYGTDCNYINDLANIKQIARSSNNITLSIIGHSLDITDVDIITELFNVATKINIYYHNEDAIGSYIKNLVAIYGRKEFDTIRSSKHLEFLELQ